MGNKRFTLIYLAVSIFVLIGLIYFFLSPGAEKRKLVLVPKERIIETAEVIGTEVGTGWSCKDIAGEAAEEAINMALEGKINKSPDFAVIFASSGSDIQAILSKARKVLGDKAKIYGGSSDSRAVMTDKGFVKVSEKGYELTAKEAKRGIAVMTVSSKEILFGVGSSDFTAYGTVQEAAKAAVLNAISSAGKPEGELPQAILITVTIGTEEEAIEGIEEVIGKKTPILGGTAGGPEFAVFGNDRVYNKGISIAVIYTTLPIGWTFKGGFDVTSVRSGIVTKTQGQAIIEIDNRPALDVYDEWLDGDIERLYKEIGRSDIIRDLLVLHPLYRKYSSPDDQDYFLFSHPWPKDSTLRDKTVITSTKIKTGERIYLGSGTWEILINRIGNLPKEAKHHGNIGIDSRPILGIGCICAGVMGVIPESERPKMPLLINYANSNAPFIANLTWGEQGYFPGIGNKHGNLLTSFLIIAEKNKR